MSAFDLAPGVAAAFTRRSGGTSRPPYDSCNLALHVGDDPTAVVANRAATAAALGVDPDRTTWCEQVHGDRVAVVAATGIGRGSRAAAEATPGVDGLVTGESAAPLAVLVADCVPVLLADPRGRLVAAVHAGRRGLAAGVVQVAVGTLLDAGAARERLVAAVGPAIGPCCYDVGADVQQEVVAAVPAARATSRSGGPALDLRAGVRRVLADEGVEAVRTVGGCTAHEPGSWFSYRRDGRTGRQAGYVWLR